MYIVSYVYNYVDVHVYLLEWDWKKWLIDDIVIIFGIFDIAMTSS